MVDSAASFLSLNNHHGSILHPITSGDSHHERVIWKHDTSFKSFQKFGCLTKAVKIQLTTPVLLRVVLVSMQIWPEGWHAGGGQGLET